MKRILLLPVIISISTFAFAQKVGIGIQSSFYTHGISVKFKINDYNTLQGVVSLLGPYSSYTGRYVKGFSEKDLGSSVELQPYIMGMGSLHTIKVPDYVGGNIVSSSFGYGVGGGIAWKFSSFEYFEISTGLNDIFFIISSSKSIFNIQFSGS